MTSANAWEPDRLFIGVAVACPSSPPWARESSISAHSLNARMAFLCKSRGVTTINEIAQAINIRSRIISTICPFRELCFRLEPRHFAEQFVGRGSRAMKYVHLHDFKGDVSNRSASEPLRRMSNLTSVSKYRHPRPELDELQLLRRDLHGRVLINIQVRPQHFARNAPEPLVQGNINELRSCEQL